MSTERLVLGTRGSALARTQAEGIRTALASLHPGVEIDVLIVETRGDLDTAPLWRIGGQGLFTRELEAALGRGQVDVAVHSLKDLPTRLDDAFVLAAQPRRGDPRDALVTREGLAFDALPPGTAVGTSSLRRRAQILASRADLCPRDLRGNLDTRLGRVASGGMPAAVLAAAGLERLGGPPPGLKAFPLPLEAFLPAAGQGALGLEARAGDRRVLDLLAPLDHADTRSATSAERALLGILGAGCHAPLGAYAAVRDGALLLKAFLAHPDGQGVIRTEGRGAPGRPGELAAEVAARLLASGARAVLDAAEASLR